MRQEFSTGKKSKQLTALMLRFWGLGHGEKGNQLCASHADSEGNTKHLHDSKGGESTSMLGHVCTCPMERHFLQQGRKPLDTQTIFSRSQEKGICLAQCP